MKALAATSVISSIASAVQSGPATEPSYVFFDFGKPVLTKDAEALLEGIASSARGQGSLVELTGFSDAAGPAGANRAVARQRAAAVRTFLIAHGIAPERVRVTAFGEERLLVATADGVREPQNRRVEVRLIAQSAR